MEILGLSRSNFGNTGPNTVYAANWNVVILKEPDGPPRQSLRDSRPDLTSLSAGSSERRSLSPAGVAATLRVVRANNCPPKRTSNPLMVWLRAEGEIPRSAAARVKLR